MGEPWGHQFANSRTCTALLTQGVELHAEFEDMHSSIDPGGIKERNKGDIAIHGGCLENLGNFRFLVLDLFTWELRHASICASVGRRVLL